MKVTEAKFTRRFVVEQYEFEEYSLTSTVNEEDKYGETGCDALTKLKFEVLEAFTRGDVPTKKEKKNGKSKTNNAKDSNEDGEDPASEDSGDDGKGDKDDEAASPEASDDDNNSAEGGEDYSASEESSEEVPAKGKRGKASKESKEEKSKEGKKAHRRKPQHYDRSIEQHKDKFKVALESVAPDWKKNEESKRKAKKASENLEGDEFLDENGDVMPEFITKIRKLMK